MGMGVYLQGQLINCEHLFFVNISLTLVRYNLWQFQ